MKHQMTYSKAKKLHFVNLPNILKPEELGDEASNDLFQSEKLTLSCFVCLGAVGGRPQTLNATNGFAG